jgi:alcohol dehydrogenase (cytochrome c)
MKSKILLAGLALASATIAAAQSQPQVNVPFERIRNADRDPGNWLTYSGNYFAHRHTKLTQITPANVANLKPIWVYQQADTSKWEVSPIVADGIMYITERPNIVTALDTRTGRPLWNYRRPLPTDVPVCCGIPNRGLAILGDAVYLGTFDAHIVCLDALTGQERWDTTVIDYRDGYNITVAPLAVKDKIVIGVSGGEFGIRGFLDAYDAKTGKLAWRCYTIPGPGEPGNETWAGDSWKIGGGATWVTGAYDPDLNLIYWGTSNPSPDYNGDVRKGDNQWTASDVAIDADTGKLRWGFQFTPHDTHDWDANQVPVLIDANFNGQPRKMLMHANRNGFYYVLDRTNGKFLAGQQYAKQTWAKGLDVNGRPLVIPNLEPTAEGVLVYPGLEGSTNWLSPSYSPQTGLFYVQTKENYGQYYYKLPWDYVKGEHFENGGGRNVLGEEPYGALKALEATTGKLVWEFRQDVPGTTSPNAGVMSTASGLVFSGTREGYIFALDAKTGKNLWQFMTGGAVYGSTISFMVDGKQRVAVTTGSSLYVFGL